MFNKCFFFTLQAFRVPCPLRSQTKFNEVPPLAAMSLRAQMMRNLGQRRQTLHWRRRHLCQPKPHRFPQLEEMQAFHKDPAVLPTDILAKSGEVMEEAGEARAPGDNGAETRIDPGKEDTGAVATGIGEVMAVGRKAGSAMEEDKMTIASAVLKKRNGAAAAEHHCAETRVVRLESNCKRGRRPIRALQWESCISSASIAAGGLARSIHWSNTNGAANTVLRSKARVRAPRARPDDNALVAAGSRMKLGHGSSTTMLALLVILIQPRKRSQRSQRSKRRLSSNPPALPALQVEVR